MIVVDRSGVQFGVCNLKQHNFIGLKYALVVARLPVVNGVPTFKKIRFPITYIRKARVDTNSSIGLSFSMEMALVADSLEEAKILPSFKEFVGKEG
jgi:hypothetical protein